MEEDRMPKKIFIQELEGTRWRGRVRKGWKEEVERELQVPGVRWWRELVTGKNGTILCDRPKPTAGCSVNGRRRRRRRVGRRWGGRRGRRKKEEVVFVYDKVTKRQLQVSLTFRHRASCILVQAFHFSPENAFYIFNQQMYFIIWYLLDRASLI
jgi:hypothetical protein